MTRPSRPSLRSVRTISVLLAGAVGVMGGHASGQTPRLVKDLRTDPNGNSTPWLLASANQRALFMGFSSASGFEPWGAGPGSGESAQLIDANPGTGSSTITLIGSSAKGFVFQIGSTLYVSDGTPAGTAPFSSLLAGTGLTLAPGAPVLLGNSWYFFAVGADGFGRVGRTDLSLANTQIFPGSHPDFASGGVALAVINGRVLIRTAANRMYMVSILTNETQLLPTQTTGSKIAGGIGLDKVFFFGTVGSGAGTGRELCVTDGTPAGTQMLFDQDGVFGGNYGNWFIHQNGLSYTWSGFPDVRMLSTDGTPAGTTQSTTTLLTTNFTITSGAAGNLFFLQIPGEAWLYALNAGVPTLLGTFGATSVMPFQFLGQKGNSVLFVADDPATGRELWKSDGTTLGTVPVADLAPGTASSNPSRLLTLADDNFVFTATGSTPTDPVVKLRLYRTDGATVTVVPTPDLQRGEIVNVGNNIIFTARDAAVANGLYSINPLVGGPATLVHAFEPATLDASPRGLVNFGPVACFVAGVPARLHTTDGTPFGTGPVNTGPLVVTPALTPTPAPSQGPTNWNGRYVCAATIDGLGAELIAHDPATGATTSIDIAPGSAGSTAAWPTAAGGRLIFMHGFSGNRTVSSIGDLGDEPLPIIIGPVSGQIFGAFAAIGSDVLFASAANTTLYRSDGTPPSVAVPLGPYNLVTSDGLNNYNPVAQGDKAYFLTQAGNNANLHRYDRATDGVTAAGGTWNGQTVFVSFGVRPLVLPLPDQTAYFFGTTPATGQEIFHTAGTPGSTTLVAELTPGTASNSFYAAQLLGNRLIVLRRGTTTMEAWAVGPVGSAPVRLSSDVGTTTGTSRPIALHDGKVYFGSTMPDGARIWVTDGTPAGTTMLPPLSPPSALTINWLQSAGSRLYFGATWAVAGNELGVIDFCPVDIDNDTLADLDDLFILLNRFFTNDPRADFDGGGTVSLDDVFIYLNAWFAGCS